MGDLDTGATLRDLGSDVIERSVRLGADYLSALIGQASYDLRQRQAPMISGNTLLLLAIVVVVVLAVRD